MDMGKYYDLQWRHLVFRKTKASHGGLSIYLYRLAVFSSVYLMLYCGHDFSE